jgi:hypothetical protein
MGELIQVKKEPVDLLFYRQETALNKRIICVKQIIEQSFARKQY